ncbi:hypothetical protein ACG95N_13955 [Acinetobacter guillouiae]|uniref:hypothetical protein n=1 Tax=Acinetobacter guillouiae TaxID=106649 RepID=UPI003AF54143
MTKVAFVLKGKKYQKLFLMINIFILFLIIFTVFRLLYLIVDYKKESSLFEKNSETLNQVTQGNIPQENHKNKIDMLVLDKLMQARSMQTNYNHIQYAVNKELIVSGNTKNPTDVNLIVSNASSKQLNLAIVQVQMDAEKNVNFELKQVLK